MTNPDETDLAEGSRRLIDILVRGRAPTPCLLMVRTMLRCASHALRAMHLEGR